MFGKFFLRSMANRGNVKAQYELGQCYLEGRGVAKDYERAVECFRKAANWQHDPKVVYAYFTAQAHVRGQLLLGFCYYYGRGVTKDFNQAAIWYRSAWEYVLPRALVNYFERSGHQLVFSFIHERMDSSNALFYTELRAYANAIYEYDEDVKKAIRQREMLKRTFWTTLSGLDFERDVADLYRRMGYESSVTQASGDHGVDIELRRNGIFTVVQCKQHAKSAGPATVRELYGAMVHAKADSAILVCTTGFTTGVYNFVQDKPIELVDVDGLVKMQESLSKQ